ncbi:MAG TPA: arsenic resistance N-acetyltransferase ArsN2 [Deltaproteobacteria bacterium]|nr:arsenic resistance N-acetyltransferase ArsN2 [Deltaproteobacteria bacterium]HOM30208.1 arsenic resistance N-acetyltransferase ArsN2 [Deltaproteobacteria bacterium]HPP80368.1 arsenic resistance N-acetyltransferase ArsN2 [Deltaproteobacteria bacterium]
MSRGPFPQASLRQAEASGQTARRKEALESLQALYREIDRLASRTASLLAGRLRCRRGCSSCCVDGITVFEVEASTIATNNKALLEAGSAHPQGACAFLDPEGACRIYPDRPYVCRTQGLPLRWMEQGPDGSLVEMRDICPVNEPLVDLTALDASLCWPIGPVEERLACIQMSLSGRHPTRIGLRSLFGRTCPVSFGPCTKEDLAEVKSLLEAAGLDARDVTAGTMGGFVQGRSLTGTLVACAGVEPHGTSGLLRSVAVHPGFRGCGHGAGVVHEAERLADSLGVTRLYLLTTTASPFMERLGYTITARDAVPAEIRSSGQFTSLCPQSATCMTKDLKGGKDG